MDHENEKYPRSRFRVMRACGRCEGSGSGRTCFACPVCDGWGKRPFWLYAEELTEAEIHAMPPDQAVVARLEQNRLAARNAAALKASEGGRWEDSVDVWKVVGKGGSTDIPIPPKRQISKQNPPPIKSTNPRVWLRWMQAEDRREREAGESIALGHRSFGLKGQRLIG